MSVFYILAGSRLKNIEYHYDEFVDNFCEQLQSLNEHDFVAKKQSEYLKDLKEKLRDDEIIAILDFSENMSFELQDATQSYYYSKDQCTIHPICLYYKENSELKQSSIIVIAESLKHNVEAVHLIQTKLVNYLKHTKEFAKKTDIKFFSDGAPQQYKNKYNFLDLCSFKKEFELDAEWHFFATSHGKSPCDALGGTFKRNARIHNMQQPVNGITNAKDLFEWTQNLENSKVHFIYCSKDEYEEHYKLLNDGRFSQKVRTVRGTQSLHSFIPFDENTVLARIFSGSEEEKPYKLL